MEEGAPKHPSAKRVDEVLRGRGLAGRVRELPASTRTAPDAAAAVDCDVRQIVKSLVFRKARSGSAVLVLASGGHRVDEALMEREVGEPLVRADPEFVRSVTGFAIGGVPPVGLERKIPTFIDYDLLEFREIWAAAGHPNAVFRMTARELLDLTDGRVVPVAGGSHPAAPQGRWVTFDCYGTLVDWKTGLLRALDEMAGPTSQREKDRLFDAYLREEQRVESGPYRSYREIVAESVRSAAASLGIELDDSAATQLPESIPEWPVFPDTQAALRTLRSHGWRVGVLSNVDRDLLDRTMRHHGLHPDLCVTASEVRSYKPWPAHWVRFLKLTHASPEHVYHSAGAYPYDIPPAARLGFRTVYIRRYPGEEVGPDAQTVLPDLAALAERLGQPFGGPAADLRA
jgi:2-haloacid dehalogenase